MSCDADSVGAAQSEVCSDLSSVSPSTMAASAASEMRPPPLRLSPFGRARSPDRREQQGGIVENKVDAGLPQPARLEAGVVDDDATATEEIGQYNQRARRNGTVEDHHGDALTVRELHGAHAVAGRRQPGRLDVEGEESIAREGALRDRQAWRAGARRGQGTPKQLFPSTTLKVKIFSPHSFEKIFTSETSFMEDASWVYPVRKCLIGNYFLIDFRR